MEYDVVIIGAGTAGLASAVKLSSQGKKVLVLERQPVPGGVATSFKRRGFTFESALHLIDGLAPSQEVREFLDEFGVSDKIGFIELKEFGRVIYPRHNFVVKNDFSYLISYLKENFPTEEGAIDRFFVDINKFYRHFDSFANSKMPIWLKLFLSPLFYPSVIRASCLSLEQFMAKKIKDKSLRAILGTIWGFIGLPPSQASAFYFLIVLRGYWGARIAYIKGGSGRLFNAMVQRIEERGSQAKFNTTVTEIITDKGKRVKGVRTDKGEEFKAKAVISNASCFDTLTRLIDSEALREVYAHELSGLQKSISAVIVYLGLDLPSQELGMDCPFFLINKSYDHDASFKSCLCADYAQANLAVVSHSQIDPSLAPQGKSTICVMTIDNYANWQNLTDEKYQEKKKAVADAIVASLESYLPGVSAHIEVLEVGTPRTIERFASLPEGAIYGLAQNVTQASLNRLSQNTIVKGLFLAGAWTRPGCGVHGCLVSGKDAADLAVKYLK
jgi:prolycopene isomerase